MGRRYAAKGKKKRKLEDGVASRADDAQELQPPEDDEGKGEEDGTEEDETVEVTEGIPVLPRPVDGRKRPRAIFVLERACLEVGKVGKTMQILNSDDHANYLRKHNRNPADYRPDIIYQALLAIFDSPLTKAGRLQAVYVRTEKGVLFEVKPNVRLPRTCKRFCGLMSQLLQKLSITAVGRREKLLNVIKNPVTQYLPVGSRKIGENLCIILEKVKYLPVSSGKLTLMFICCLGLSYSADKSVKLNDYVAEFSDDEALVFVVGAMAHGKIDSAYTDDQIQISSYPLSAAWCLGKICTALEQKWDIHLPGGWRWMYPLTFVGY
uniref:Ribosomal RNA small subunit methyltransferase NEP1 n=1 Tax=Aegilops tauschii TaxID=37682 RepID=R7WBS5_AEGTA